MGERLKILLTVLVSHDLPRAIRAIKTCQLQTNHNLDFEICVVINTLNNEFKKEMVEYCEISGVGCEITESDGTASTGKNSVFKVFDKRVDFTHLVQIDGDDFIYPVFLRHMERHLTKYPTTDVIGILPCDSIYTNHEPSFYKLENGSYAGIWETNYSAWFREWIQFDTDKIFTNNSKGNLARLTLFSRKIPNKFFYDKEQVIGEDYKLHFDLLLAHRKDEISYWFSSASDTSVRDTTSMGVQKKDSNLMIDGHYVITKNEFYEERLKKYVLETNGEFRSGSGEIPIDFPPIYMDAQDKINYFNQIL
jgi:hypothetical protein